jgi:hypothetical protein
MKSIMMLCKKLKVKRIAILSDSKSERRFLDFKKIFESNGVSIIAYFIIYSDNSVNNWSNIFRTLHSVDAR